MKKMNKVAAAVLAVAMVGSMAMPAFAKDAGAQEMTSGSTSTTLKQEGKTKLTYVIDESYSWKIPADTTFDKGNNKGVVNGEVKVENCIINLDHTLTITIKPQDAKGNAIDSFQLNTEVSTATKQAVMGYEVMKTTESAKVDVGGTVLTLKGGTNGATTKLSFTLKDDQDVGSKTAGTYAGYVQFNASVS